MAEFIDLFLHFDVHLAELVATYGASIYAILFVIIFAETGLVVTPILPGDSLLFACGALAATGVLDPWLTAGLLVTAAILGDAVNYTVGHFAGPKIFSAEDHAASCIDCSTRTTCGRRMPSSNATAARPSSWAASCPSCTFVPFVAGAGEMTYASFAFYNVTGAFIWVGLCVGLGYAFGNVPVVKENFSLVALGIVFVSMLPMAYELLQRRRAEGAA